MRFRLLSLMLLMVAFGFIACNRPPARAAASRPTAKRMSAPPAAAVLRLTSPAIKDGQPIPKKYTADGTGVSPPLRWTKPPAGTKEFALVVRDPDAPQGVFIHWVIYAVPPTAEFLPENTPTTEVVPIRGNTVKRPSASSRGVTQFTPILGNAKQGMNSANKVGWTPPSPPPGKVHHYIFTLYALDKRMDLPPRATEEHLARVMKGHVLGQAELTGIYRR